MRKLFSPWRSEYIESFKGEKKKEICLFCRIAKEKGNDEENLIVWRGKKCFIVMNRFPYNSGHLMIVPYKHTSLLTKLTEKENSEIMATVAKCIRGLEKTSKPDGFNFGANLGRVAGAGIDKHVHFHLVPRWNGDTNFMPTIAETKVVSEGLNKSWNMIKKALK
jgi:ATP adenylyltransferase